MYSWVLIFLGLILSSSIIFRFFKDIHIKVLLIAFIVIPLFFTILSKHYKAYTYYPFMYNLLMDTEKYSLNIVNGDDKILKLLNSNSLRYKIFSEFRKYDYETYLHIKHKRIDMEKIIIINNNSHWSLFKIRMEDLCV